MGLILILKGFKLKIKERRTGGVGVKHAVGVKTLRVSALSSL